MNSRVIIIHGTKGSPDGNWFPWLKSELINRNINSFTPRFPTPDHQTLSSWKDAFKNHIGEISSHDILVGHSLGSLFCLHLIQESPSPPFACYLVAPFLEEIGIKEYDELNKSFYSKNLKAPPSPTEFTCFYSDNDPYVPLKLSQAVTHLVSGHEVIIPGGKHLNSEAGYDTFPALRDLILKKLLGEAL